MDFFFPNTRQHLPLAALPAFLVFSLQPVPFAKAAGLNYPVAGAEIGENFDSLPIGFKGNTNIQATWSEGWADDSETLENVRVSLPGWYLYYPLATAAEGGTNTHQRLRFGPGANTGSFWAFGASASDSEKALGSLGSTTVAANGAPMFMALRLVNGTGTTLNAFTVTFDGEQWRDGASPDPETLTCSWSLTATVDDWNTSAAFTDVPSLSFTAPVFTGTGGSGTAVDGNVEGLQAGLTATITGIAWAPGADLWLRWADPQLAGAADDGLAIDNLLFKATTDGVIPPVQIPEASLSLLPSDGHGPWQLKWNGVSGITTRIQHSTNGTDWATENDPVLETTGIQTWSIPAALTTNNTRLFLRLSRTSAP
jgi:hypothetical protein